jgi:glycosyltransferase involved in cell wall biosynthesis
MPRVSIGMSVHNGARTLGAALTSLQLQSLQDWELVLVDDGSTDDSVAIAESFADARIRIVQGGVRRTLPVRLNQTIDLARAAVYARMDADDIAYPERLERQLSFLQQHPDVDLTGCGVLVFSDGGLPRGTRINPATHEQITARPWARFPLDHPTFMGRTDWFRRHRYSEWSRLAQDQGLLLRSFRTSRFANLPEVLLGYRENAVRLKKVLRGRAYYVRSAAAQGSRHPLLLFQTLLTHSARAAWDTLAAATGMAPSHRAPPLRPGDATVWAQVWHEVRQHAPTEVI